MATGRVGICQLVVHRIRLYVLNGVRRRQSQASTAYGVRHADRDPDRVLHATGLMTPFKGQLHRTRRIGFLGNVHARRSNSRLANGRRGQYAIGRNVNCSYGNVDDPQAAYRRTGARFSQCANGALDHVYDPLFVAGRGIVRSITVIVRHVGCQRSDPSQVARGHLRTFVLRETRRYFQA